MEHTEEFKKDVLNKESNVDLCWDYIKKYIGRAEMETNSGPDTSTSITVYMNDGIKIELKVSSPYSHDQYCHEYTIEMVAELLHRIKPIVVGDEDEKHNSVSDKETE